MSSPYDFAYLPITIPISAGVGFIYGKITNASPKMCGICFAIHRIADVTFMILGALVAHKIGCADKISINKGYVFTNLAANTVFLCAMSHLKLIGRTGIYVWLAITIITFSSYYNNLFKRFD